MLIGNRSIGTSPSRKHGMDWLLHRREWENRALLGQGYPQLTYCVSNRLEVSRQGCRSHENFMTKYGANLGRLSSQHIVHGNHPRVVVNSAAQLI